MGNYNQRENNQRKSEKDSREKVTPISEVIELLEKS